MLYAGFDPGIASPAVAVVRRDVTGYCVIEARGCTTDPKASTIDRINVIWDELSAVLRDRKPALLTLERQSQVMAAARFGHGGFNANNDKTHVTVGAAIGCARAYRVQCIEVSPQQVKIALLGKGASTATKRQIQEGVARFCGVRLSQAKADAVAIAIAGAQRAQVNALAMQMARPIL